jgi:hypothetical protein
MVLYGAEILTLWQVDQMYMECCEIRCRRRMEKISWTDRVRSEEVLRSVRGESKILRTIKRKKANAVCHILFWNCLLKRVTELKIEGRI